MRTQIVTISADNMVLFGIIKEWSSEEEKWKNYVERFNFYFPANDLTNKNKKRAILLSVVGAKNYGVLLITGQMNNRMKIYVSYSPCAQ